MPSTYNSATGSPTFTYFSKTTRDDNAGLPLSQTLLLREQLTRLEDRLHRLLASYQFYDTAIRAMTAPDYVEHTALSNEECHFEFYLNQQWLQQQGEEVITELITTQQVMRP